MHARKFKLKFHLESMIFFLSNFLRKCENSQDNHLEKSEQKLEQDSACVVCPKMINSVCGPEQIICFSLTDQNKLIGLFSLHKTSCLQEMTTHYSVNCTSC